MTSPIVSHSDSENNPLTPAEQALVDFMRTIGDEDVDRLIAIIDRLTDESDDPQDVKSRGYDAAMREFGSLQGLSEAINNAHAATLTPPAPDVATDAPDAAPRYVVERNGKAYAAFDELANARAVLASISAPLKAQPAPKLSAAERKLLQRMADGWTLRKLMGNPNYIIIRDNDYHSNVKRSVVDSVWTNGYIDGWNLTDAGRAALDTAPAFDATDEPLKVTPAAPIKLTPSQRAALELLNRDDTTVMYDDLIRGWWICFGSMITSDTIKGSVVKALIKRGLIALVDTDEYRITDLGRAALGGGK